MPAWTDVEIERLKSLWAETGGRCATVGKIMGRTTNSIIGKSNVLGLQFHGQRGRTLHPEDGIALYGGTVFQSRIRRVDGSNVLKSGANNRKLGVRVEKGKWKGFPIFSLTLEERATCPRYCALWLSCYGNNSRNAKRYVHGPALEAQIMADLAALQEKHPKGFVVRLHQLGDFYSVDYVDLWAEALDLFPALHVFGYTARNDTSGANGHPDLIGERVAALRDFRWDRFAVRTSGAVRWPNTRTIKDAAKYQRGPARGQNTIICPAQTGRTKNCSTCGLCWSEAAMHKTIAFIEH